MTAPLPYRHLLKREPTQARSRARVEAILDAAAGLLADGDREAVTVRDIAAGAGVPTGTLYQFFEDKPAVLQALAVRYVHRTPDVLGGALARPDRDWRTVLPAVVDGFAELLRREPAMRVLWLHSSLDAATVSLADAADDQLARDLARHLRQIAQAPDAEPETAPGWRVLISVVSSLLRGAFLLDPAGDEATLREARRVATVYAGTLLGLVAQP